MSKITIATRIVPDWYRELNQIIAATGQTQSAIVEEAIGLYLKKSRRLKVTSRLDALEQRVDKIAAIALK